MYDIPGRTTDHNGRILEIRKPVVRNQYELPEILQKKCMMAIGEIEDGEVIPSSLPAYANKSHISVMKKKTVFKGDQARIVTEEFASGNMGGYDLGRDLQCFNEFKVEKAKPGIVFQPISNIYEHLPAGLVVKPYENVEKPD